MDFDLNADEVALKEEVRRFCTDRFPLSVAREFGVRGGFDRARWKELGSLGVFEMLDSQADPMDLGVVGAVVVFEELGRALVPGPLIACALGKQVESGVTSGDAVITAVERPPSGAAFVEHLDVASSVAVVDEEGVWRVDVSDLADVRHLEPLDLSASIAYVPELPRGTQVGDAADARRFRLLGSLLASSMLAGIADATTDRGTEYAKVRHQFNRPIGSFQAVKHLLADMLAHAEVCRAAVYMAGAVMDDPSAGRPEDTVATARVVAGEWALANAKSCIQVHGGVGFTWEADPHLYLKRAYALAHSFGSVDSAAELVAASL